MVRLMETERAYFRRKWQELSLIARCLSPPTSRLAPSTIEGVIETKFRLAAALKAQHAIRCWQSTETCWQPAAPIRAGPFKFAYRYQRADLAVAEGPFPYGSPDRLAGAEIQQLTYACSGMAAISAVLLALSRPAGTMLLYRGGCYKETLELAASWIPGLDLVAAECAKRPEKTGEGEQVMWLEAPLSGSMGAGKREWSDEIGLAVFDTTCFHPRSGRIRQAAAWARHSNIPLILVRSHTKLDSLGIEYGRLGSAVFLGFPEVPGFRTARLRELARQVQELVRLLGSAALPAHFCPFAAGPDYVRLSLRRSAALLRNGRLLAYILRRELGSSALRAYPHGLFAALMPPYPWGDAEATAAADDIAASLARQRLPVRHAGSFGFDFAAVESFFDTQIDRYVVRIAPGDLPSAVCARVAEGIASWCAHQWCWRAA